MKQVQVQEDTLSLNFWLIKGFSGGKKKNHRLPRFPQIVFFNPCKSVKSVVNDMRKVNSTK